MRWLARLVPTSAHPLGRRRAPQYWVRGSDTIQWQAFTGSDGPPRSVTDRAVFYFNGDRVHRDYGHDDGPSSVPYYEVRHGRLYPAEGYPSGPSTRAHYVISPWPRPTARQTKIKPNPRHGELDDPPSC